MTDEPKPEESPLKAVGREFAQICHTSGTEVALANLIALQQRQAARLAIALGYTDPSRSPPPPGTPQDVIDLQGDMVQALQRAETRMQECEFWLTQAAAIRQHMTALLGRKAPPARDEPAPAEEAAPND
ncbi:MAG: hypothetical protein O7G84_00820 [Gammaproteobacteria bacterium]|nr:hypothetical protein [Gammaproteobacteria bacterium]